MDRISALRNVEAALTEFEQGETDLDGLERQVQAVLRTYATDFEDERTAVYVVAATAPTDAADATAADAGDSAGAADAADEADAADAAATTGEADATDTAPAAGTTATEVVVVASSPAEARDRASEIAGIESDRATARRLSERA